MPDRNFHFHGKKLVKITIAYSSIELFDSEEINNNEVIIELKNNMLNLIYQQPENAEVIRLRELIFADINGNIVEKINLQNSKSYYLLSENIVTGIYFAMLTGEENFSRIYKLFYNNLGYIK